MAIKDLTGQTFNRLTVLEFAYRKNGRTFWWCECSCSAKTRLLVRADCLQDDNTQSCGCQKIEAATKHGHNAVSTNGGPSPTYVSWMSMMERCTREQSPHYARYGARGIRVCTRWYDFRNFLADMGERPQGMTLDRFPDNDGHYEPTNCRWATPLQQSHSRRNTPMLTFEGRTQTLLAWAEERGIPYPVYVDRRRKQWTDEEIILTPYKPYRNSKQSRMTNPC